MQSRTIKVANPHGVHLRVAGKFVEAIKNFKSRVTLCRDFQYADGRSILQILFLAATKDSELKIVIVGEDEEKAIRELPELFEDGAGI